MAKDQQVAVLGLGIIGTIWMQNWLNDGINGEGLESQPQA